MRRRALSLLIFPMLAGWAGWAGCASVRLSHEDARQKISAIARSKLVPDSIEIRRIVYQGETQALAETTVTLAFQFKKDPSGGEWRVDAVRLSDNDWIPLTELLNAVNESRRKATAETMQKLVVGITEYRSKTGSFPEARDIVTLTNVLHPLYMSELVRVDGWGSPIDYEVTVGSGYRLVSKGADGLRGTPDDIVLP